LLFLVFSLCVFTYELNLCTFFRQTQSSIFWIQSQLTPRFNIWTFSTTITNKLMLTNNIQNVSNSKCPQSNRTLINWTFRFDLPSHEGLSHSKL
jgi:hypothetical protein